MKKDLKYRKILHAIHHYLVFFLLMAFIITCCMMLFITVFSKTLDITLTEENLTAAAKLTFANVVFLSLVCTVIDGIRRKFTIDRPVKRITEATKRIMQGDFSVRIRSVRRYESDDKFSEIAECINKMAEELSGIETLRTDFVANVSHEIKTPLSVIGNYASMLSRQDLSEDTRREYAEIIAENTHRLSTLISNILKLNKLENQSIYPQGTVYHLGEQLCECLLSFENAWEKKSLDVETDIEDDVFVKTDAEMMALVWNNLFSNAIKFTEPGGKIRLSLTSDETHAIVKVSDSGCGISKEVGIHMFEKFYQGDTSHSTEGNGLGLTLVKRVIDVTDSEIEVESELGKGTTFTVRIKRSPNETH